jgi:hypothetical protein
MEMAGNTICCGNLNRKQKGNNIGYHLIERRSRKIINGSGHETPPWWLLVSAPALTPCKFLSSSTRSMLALLPDTVRLMEVGRAGLYPQDGGHPLQNGQAK